MRQLRRAVARFYLLGRKAFVKLFPPPAPDILPEPDTPTDLNGRVVIITGSSRGIGLALAGAFAEAGARVVINGRSRQALDRAMQKLHGRFPDVYAVQADVATPEGAAKLIGNTVERFGSIAVLVNNAGVPGRIDKPAWEVSPEEWREVQKVNVTGPFLCSGEVARWALKHGQPVRIVNVSSSIVGHGALNLGSYGVSKMGLEGLTQAIAADSDSAPPGLISAVSIKPRSVRTGMTERYFPASDYALMDEPGAVAGVFLHAATAPLGDIMGRSIDEPVYAADVAAAITLKGALAGAPPIDINPETYRADRNVPGIDQPGAYMHLLENPVGFYPGVADAIGGELQSRKLYCYPDPAYPELRGAIAKRHGIDPGQVALGAGSTELIDRVLRTFCAEGDQIVVTKPTWSFFMAFFRRWGLRPVQVPHLGSLKEKNLRHDLGGILAAVTWRTRLIYLVNPCNPTGAAADPEELKDFLHKVPTHVTVMLDEAYFDYSDIEVRLDVSRLLEGMPARVIGLRTFSKFFALSGLRIGYAYANTETIGLLERSGIPFNVASVSQLAANAALQDTEKQHQVRHRNIAERQRISAELDRLNIEHMPSQTNFVLFDCPLNQNRFREILLGKGLVMPDVQQFLQNYAVIAVGLPEHNQLVLDTLAQY